MPCPLGTCACHHLASEVCGRDTPGGLAYRDRLAKARSAFGDQRKNVGVPAAEPVAHRVVAEVAAGAMDWLGPAEPKQVEVKAAPAKRKGKGGRLPGPKPWKDRLKAYKREYMRKFRARKGTG